MRTEYVTPKDATAMEQTLANLLQVEGIENLAYETGFVKRRRLVKPMDFLCSLIVCFGGAKLEWLSQVHRSYCTFSGVKLSYKPFHNQLRKPECSDWLQAVLLHLMNFYTTTQLVCDRKGLEQFDDIIIHDGSSFGLKDCLASEYPGRFTKTSPAAAELHCTLSLFGSCPHRLILSPDKDAEKHYRPDPKMLRNNLFLADRGYEDLMYFRGIQNEGGSYIARGKKSIRPIVKTVYNSRGRRVKRLEGRPLCIEKLKGQDYDMTVVWPNIDGSTFQERLLVLHKKGPRNKKDFTLLHTNLSRSKFRVAAIKKLYRFRWQVELFFKECKSYANLKKFDTGIAEIADSTIWAALCAATFRRIFINQVQRILRLTLSNFICASSSFTYIDRLFRAIVFHSSKIARREIQSIMQQFADLFVEPKINKLRTRQLIGMRYPWESP